MFDHVRDAITMLGLDRVRAVTTLMMLGSFSNKPPELARLALIRARYCQLIGAARGGDPQKHFAAGLFSVLDAFLDDSMENVLSKLPLDPEITAALLQRSGPMGEALEAAVACERAEWESAIPTGVDLEELSTAYIAALSWADRMQKAVDPN